MNQITRKYQAWKVNLRWIKVSRTTNESDLARVPWAANESRQLKVSLYPNEPRTLRVSDVEERIRPCVSTIFNE